MSKERELILVLGADGFIGSNLIKKLLKKNKYKIRAFDLFKDGKTKNLKNIENKIEIFSGNFLNRNDLRNALKDVDYVFHFISLTTPGSSMEDPFIDVDTNIKGTLGLFEECVNAGTKKIIFSSSGGAIYGNSNSEFQSEEDNTNPISPYAISKLVIEKYLEYYRLNKGLDYLVLRYANPYGPGQNVVGGQGIIPIFLNLIKQNKCIHIFGDGENIRDYIYIDDMIDMTIQIFSKNTKYTIYNIGSGKGESINNVIKTIQTVVGKNISTVKQPERLIDVRRIVLDVSRVYEEINFIPKITLSRGIMKTWKWINNIKN